MKTYLLAATLLSALITACGSSTPAPPSSSSAVSTIEVTPSPCALTKSNSLQMKAVATFPDGSKKDITDAATWSSGNVETATVNTTGIVVGVNLGATGISAAYEGASRKQDCTVAP